MSVIKQYKSANPHIKSFLEDQPIQDYLEWSFSSYSSTYEQLPGIKVEELSSHVHIQLRVPHPFSKKFSVVIGEDQIHVELKDRKNLKSGEVSMLDARFQSYKRSLTFPCHLIAKSRTKTKYENGILHIYLQKKKSIQKKVKRIS